MHSAVFLFREQEGSVASVHQFHIINTAGHDPSFIYFLTEL